MTEFPIVAIGSSAGGLEALQTMFRAMPPETGAGFVIAAHLDPTRESHLADLLGRCTAMPVTQIEDAVRIEPNRVYVIAPDQELTIREGVVRPNKPDAPRGHRHPVDSFFRSLAEDQGERAIAIVLSGTGSNGSLGLRFVKAEGGIVLVQTPETARFDGMPRSAIGTGLADLVLPPGEIPAALVDLFSHPYLKQPAKAAETPEQDFASLLALVRNETGKDFSSYRKSTLLRRIHRRMGLHRIPSLGEYVKRLGRDESEVTALTADLTINVTGFFRDPAAWNELGERVIAPLVRDRGPDRPIRAWVPGCSTGEEAYTVAMLVTEHAEAMRKQVDLRIFATDVAAGVLAPARAGAYPSSIDQDLTPERLQRFFDMEDDTYTIKKSIREALTFAPQNLLQDPPFSRLDLIACRNLLIYLEPPVQKQVLALFHFALRENGHLFLGTSETASGQEELFEAVSKRWRIFRRLGPTRHDIVDFPLVSDGSRAARSGERSSAPPPAPRGRAGELADRTLLDRYAPASVLVDERFRIHHFRGPTGDYLQPPSGEPSHNLLAMAREGLQTPLRTAVAGAFEHGREMSVDARVRRGGEFDPLRIVARPLRTEDAERRVLVSFIETEFRQPPEPPAPPLPGRGEETRLQTELDFAREDLRHSIEQMEATNEELKASNEEVRSINEELQASNEELETSKEELQSLNEELNTVNSQLQAKLRELEERTGDLNNLLNSTEIATLFLDRGLCIRWFTPRMKELLDLRQTDIGRPATHFAQRFSDGDMFATAKRVIDTLLPAEDEVVSEDGRWFLRRILPYRTTSDRIDGVVMTFMDMTERKRSAESLRRSEERLKRVLETDAVGVIFFDERGRLIDANEVFLRMTGYSRAEVQSRALTWRDMTPPEWVEASEEQFRLFAETGRLGPYEKEYILKDGSRRWMLFAGRDLGDGTMAEYVIDVTARKRAEGERELLTRELSHRVKNTLAIVQALAMQTDGKSTSVEQYREKFIGRLHALGRVHSLLLESHWRGANLRSLVDRALEPYRGNSGQTIETRGEPVPVGTALSLGLSMALHELATNALKYGALSAAGGRLEADWTIGDDGLVRLVWRESGGPPVTPPEREGFGTRLIQHALGQDPGAGVDLDFRRDGLVCTLVFPPGDD